MDEGLKALKDEKRDLSRRRSLERQKLDAIDEKISRLKKAKSYLLNAKAELDSQKRCIENEYNGCKETDWKGSRKNAVYRYKDPIVDPLKDSGWDLQWCVDAIERKIVVLIASKDPIIQIINELKELIYELQEEIMNWS